LRTSTPLLLLLTLLGLGRGCLALTLVLGLLCVGLLAVPGVEQLVLVRVQSVDLLVRRLVRVVVDLAWRGQVDKGTF
jgi:hypothetical protein